MDISKHKVLKDLHEAMGMVEELGCSVPFTELTAKLGEITDDVEKLIDQLPSRFVMQDPRDNPPAGYKYDIIVTPWIERDSGCTCLWHNGLGEDVSVQGCFLMPRKADTDGTCYLFRKESKA